MEHKLLNKILLNYGVEITEEETISLCLFANEICKWNKSFNLTGLKSLEEIFDVLIARSILPMSRKNVPRGTFFLDMGTGAGVPGIPLAIVFKNFKGLLVDSNQKKVSFIEKVIGKLKLKNVDVLCHRLEDLARDDVYREKIEYVFSRGVGEPFVAMELGAAFLSVGGVLIIYSNEEHEKVAGKLKDVSLEYGLEVLDGGSKKDNGIQGNVIVFKKIEPIDDKFPRRYSVIRRESIKYLKD